MKGSAETIPGLSHQVLVQIEIARGRIHCFPQRACDTIIFKPVRVGMAAPARPLEVRWVVTGLRRGQYVQIVPKERGSKIFPRGGFQIGPDANTIASGPPRHGTGPGHCFLWKYAIVLHDERGRVLDRLDPGIIIKDYP